MNADGGERDGHTAHLEHALKERSRFEPPANPDARALSYLREGLWPVLEQYIEARSSGERLSEEEHETLEGALNVWLEFRKAFFTYCWVMVDPPCVLLPVTSFQAARTMPVKDTPGSL